VRGSIVLRGVAYLHIVVVLHPQPAAAINIVLGKGEVFVLERGGGKVEIAGRVVDKTLFFMLIAAI